MRSPPTKVAEKLWLWKLNMPFQKVQKVTPNANFQHFQSNLCVILTTSIFFLNVLTYEPKFLDMKNIFKNGQFFRCLNTTFSPCMLLFRYFSYAVEHKNVAFQVYKTAWESRPLRRFSIYFYENFCVYSLWRIDPFVQFLTYSSRLL